MRRKLGGCFRGVNSIAVLALALSLTGCLRTARTVMQVDRFEWPATLRDAARTPYLDEGVPADPVKQWEGRFGRDYTDVPSIQGDLLVSSSTAKTMTVVNAQTGRAYWERRMNGPVAGGLVRLDDRVYAATQSRDGRIEAYTLARGRHVWTFRMSSPASAGALLLDSTLYVGSQRGHLYAVHITGPTQLWRARLPAPAAAPVVAWGSDLYVLTTSDSLLAVDRKTGMIRPGTRVAGSSSAPFALQGDRLILPLHPGVIQSVRLPGLAVEWTATLGEPVLAAPALDADGTVFALTRVGDVWRIDTVGNAQRIAQLGGAASGSLTLAADGLLVGRLDGTLVMLRRDGTEVWRRKFDHSLQAPVALGNGAIYVPLASGHMVMMR